MAANPKSHPSRQQMPQESSQSLMTTPVKPFFLQDHSFPPLPQDQNQQENEYPDPLPNPPPITTKQVKSQIANLPLYKAHDPDGIPNIILKECSDLLSMPLTTIFNTIIDLNLYYDPWKESIMVVLRKPGKPNYEIPKAYQPIVLLLIMAKLLTAIIAANLSNIAERHLLLPKNHFRGRPGCSTVDTIHYLTNKVHQAWQNNKVTSILFLDVKGTFPNAVTTRLIHNLKKRRIPTAIINFVKLLLYNRKT